MGKSIISVQLQVPSDSDSASKMDARVSTDKRTLAVVFLVSPFHSLCNFASKNLMKDLLRFQNWVKDTIGYILQNHAKMAARIKLIAILKEVPTIKQFQYIQCIPHPKHVCHTFSTASNSNNIFYRCRFSVSADGAWMTHAKL
eukprot:11730716-Ditylum_brightwellii.AAC.1